ncbi:hypothetical protein bsdcttw_21550 [Anaerocolumna chitinilytica]|jgi:hypothetical protein|uniref:Uncharacterized protein n=1 Tax=Anaerocolumna chitinilytica TaxID=1727145 RepID=A0A7I8DP70_9FIRM|nr:hypothetical protein bsdcttw_21550 [Anaerocolumna chitinilytica]
MLPIDFLFRDNCFLSTFYWEDEETSDKELIRRALRAAQLLSELFISTIWTVEEWRNLTNERSNRIYTGFYS